MAEKRTDTYWNLMRQLLYSGNKLTKSQWDSGSQIENYPTYMDLFLLKYHRVSTI